MLRRKDAFRSNPLCWVSFPGDITGQAARAWQIPAGSGLILAADLPDYQDDARIILTEAIAEMCTVDTEVDVRPYVTEGRAGPVLAASWFQYRGAVVISRCHLPPGLVTPVPAEPAAPAVGRATPVNPDRSPREKGRLSHVKI